MSPFTDQILWTLQGLATPLGILLMAAFLLLLVLTLYFRQLKWFVLSLILFVTTLSIHYSERLASLMFPLEQMRNESRGVAVALMTILVISLLALPRGWRQKYFVPGLFVFMIFQIYLSLNLAIRGDFTRGSVGLIISLYTFFIFGIAIPHGLQSWNDLISYIRGIAGGGVIFAFINFLQLLVKPSAVLVNFRFNGTTNNAQFVGQICAMGLVAIAYLIVRPGKSRFDRLVFGAAGGMLLIMLTWSGSRTGVLMAVVGLGLLFRTRLSRLMTVGLIVGLFALLASHFVFPETDVVSGHLFSTTNTRAAVWHHLWTQFVNSPITGVMTPEDIGYGESSYLSVASNLGVIGLIPFLTALAMIGWSLNKLRHLRNRIADPLIVDLVIALILMTAVGAFFEAYLMGILSATLMTALAYMPILAYLLESAEAPEVLEEQVALEMEVPAQLPAGAW